VFLTQKIRRDSVAEKCGVPNVRKVAGSRAPVSKGATGVRAMKPGRVDRSNDQESRTTPTARRGEWVGLYTIWKRLGDNLKATSGDGDCDGNG
jgi:hypothetical protein